MSFLLEDFIAKLVDLFEIHESLEISNKLKYIIMVNYFCENMTSYVEFTDKHTDFIKVVTDHTHADDVYLGGIIKTHGSYLEFSYGSCEDDHGGAIGGTISIFNIDSEKQKNLKDQLVKMYKDFRVESNDESDEESDDEFDEESDSSSDDDWNNSGVPPSYLE